MEAIEGGKHHALQCFSDCKQVALWPSISGSPSGARLRYRGRKLAYTPSFRDDDTSQSAASPCLWTNRDVWSYHKGVSYTGLGQRTSEGEVSKDGSTRARLCNIVTHPCD